MSRVITNGFVFLNAVALADLAVYQRMIVPRLGAWPAVPLVWWVAVATPVVGALGAIGSLARSRSEVVWSALAAAVSVSVYLYWAAQSGQPGHLKSLAVEAPWAFWAGAPPVLFSVFALAASLVHWASAARKHRLTDR